MELTGLPFLLALAALTLALFVAVVFVTPRGRWFFVPLRALLALALVAGSLLTAAAYLNNANGWYSSWGDLVGQSQSVQGGVVGADASRAAADHGASVLPAAPSSLPPLPQPGSRLQTFTYKGAASGLTGTVLVYLPEGYEGGTDSYPVMEALHGTPGSPQGWLHQMALGDQLDQAVAGGKVAKSIVVMPQVNIPSDRDWECVDGPTPAPQLETWLTKDVPAFAVSHLRVKRDRSSWVSLGYSAGGWCSAMAGVLHPQLYGGAVVFSGYFAPEFANGAPWPAGSAKARRYDLTRAITAQPPDVALWVQAGRKSEYWSGTKAFIDAAKPPLSVTTQLSDDTGHRWDTWKNALPAALAWIGSTVPGFRA